MTRQRITVACRHGRSCSFDADVFGEWAAHPGVDIDVFDRLSPNIGWWVVTHVPSGRSLSGAVGALSKSEAMKLAETLGSRVPIGAVPEIPNDVSPPRLPDNVRNLILDVIKDAGIEVICG